MADDHNTATLTAPAQDPVMDRAIQKYLEFQQAREQKAKAEMDGQNAVQSRLDGQDETNRRQQTGIETALEKAKHAEKISDGANGRIDTALRGQEALEARVERLEKRIVENDLSAAIAKTAAVQTREDVRGALAASLRDMMDKNGDGKLSGEELKTLKPETMDKIASAMGLRTETKPAAADQERVASSLNAAIPQPKKSQETTAKR